MFNAIIEVKERMQEGPEVVRVNWKKFFVDMSTVAPF